MNLLKFFEGINTRSEEKNGLSPKDIKLLNKEDFKFFYIQLEKNSSLIQDQFKFYFVDDRRVAIVNSL